MTTPTTTPAASQPSISCTRCGYDLRGLPRDALCPECGTPLVQSLYGEYLRHRPVTWLRSLLRGAALVLVAQGGWLALSGYWLSRHGSYDWNVLVSSPLSGITLPLALTAVNLLGVLFLTSPLPHQTERVGSPRRMLRLGTAIMAVMIVTGYAPAVREPAATAFWVTFGVVQALTSFVTGVFLSTVAMRVPNKGLALETLLVAAATALLEAALYVYPWLGYGGVRGLQGGRPPVGPAQMLLGALGGYMLVLALRYYLALAAALGTAAAAGDASSGASAGA